MRFFFLLLLAGCTASGPWRWEPLTSGLTECARLCSPSNPSSPLSFELTRFGDEIEAYVSLTQFRFSETPTLRVKLSSGEEESLPVLQGRMRLRLSPTLTQRLITQLQEGHEVKISVDSFDKTLTPQDFLPLYLKLVKNTPLVQNTSKGNV